MYSCPYFNYKKVINSENSGTIHIYTIASGLLTFINLFIFFIQGLISFNNLENVKENRRDRQSNIETMISNAIIFILLSIIAGLYNFPPSCVKIGNKANDLYQKLNNEKDEILNMNINEGFN